MRISYYNPIINETDKFTDKFLNFPSPPYSAGVPV